MYYLFDNSNTIEKFLQTLVHFLDSCDQAALLEDVLIGILCVIDRSNILSYY